MRRLFCKFQIDHLLNLKTINKSTIRNHTVIFFYNLRKGNAFPSVTQNSNNKKILHGKNHHKQNQKKIPHWKKICATHVSEKGLINLIYKELLQINF